MVRCLLVAFATVALSATVAQRVVTQLDANRAQTNLVQANACRTALLYTERAEREVANPDTVYLLTQADIAGTNRLIAACH
jgi:hypothetical protein